MILRYSLVKVLLVLTATLAVSSGSAFSGQLPIAGVEPSQRPEGAPFIDQYDKTSDWRDQALQGVQEPYPPSLQFLEDQGAWYTPFNRPGMTSPYDLRNWHSSTD